MIESRMGFPVQIEVRWWLSEHACVWAPLAGWGSESPGGIPKYQGLGNISGSLMKWICVTVSHLSVVAWQGQKPLLGVIGHSWGAGKVLTCGWNSLLFLLRGMGNEAFPTDLAVSQTSVEWSPFAVLGKQWGFRIRTSFQLQQKNSASLERVSSLLVEADRLVLREGV